MKHLEPCPAMQLFKQFCQSYEKRDLPGLLKLFSPKIEMWGSAQDEYRVGLKQVEEQLKRDFSQAEHASIVDLKFLPSGPDAPWAAAHCRARLLIEGRELYFDNFRGTIVVDEEEGEWKIVHMHASFPDSRNAEASSFPVG